MLGFFSACENDLWNILRLGFSCKIIFWEGQKRLWKGWGTFWVVFHSNFFYSLGDGYEYESDPDP